LLEAPEQLTVGGRATASATVEQGSGPTARRVPVGWPVSADWPGSPGLCVKGTVPRGRCVASYDPANGTLTGRRPGTVTLAVVVNGERAEQKVTVGR
ncbi:hypothetical protein, partial [Streptomyces sp. B15]